MPPRKGKKPVKKILETVHGKEDITQDPLNSSRSKNSKTGAGNDSSFAFEEVKRDGYEDGESQVFNDSQSNLS